MIWTVILEISQATYASAIIVGKGCWSIIDSRFLGALNIFHFIFKLVQLSSDNIMGSSQLYFINLTIEFCNNLLVYIVLKFLENVSISFDVKLCLDSFMEIF